MPTRVTEATTKLIHIVTDTKGAGRIVGAFSNPDRAESVRAIDKAYFRLTTLPIDQVNPVAVEWLLTAAQRELLREA